MSKPKLDAAGRKNNAVLDSAINLFEQRASECQIQTILDTYDIDVNYGDGLLLACAIPATTDAVGDKKYFHNVRLLLRMGADPNLIMNNDLLVYDTHPVNKIRLDGLFMAYGHNCEWQNFDLETYGE